MERRYSKCVHGCANSLMYCKLEEHEMLAIEHMKVTLDMKLQQFLFRDSYPSTSSAEQAIPNVGMPNGYLPNGHAHVPNGTAHLSRNSDPSSAGSASLRSALPTLLPIKCVYLSVSTDGALAPTAC